MLCLELVETAPRMMRSTPRGKGMGWASLYHVIPKSFSGLDSWEKLGTLLYIHFCIFGKGKTRGFAALVGILVALSFDDVFLHVSIIFVNFICMPFPFSLLLKLNK